MNIWTDLKYAFGVVHAHGATWKERGMLTAQGTSIKHQEEILQLLQVVQKPKEVAIMHCKAHQFGNFPVNIGNKLVNKKAKKRAEKGIMTIIPVKEVKFEQQTPNYSKVDLELAKSIQINMKNDH